MRSTRRGSRLLRGRFNGVKLNRDPSQDPASASRAQGLHLQAFPVPSASNTFGLPLASCPRVRKNAEGRIMNINILRFNHPHVAHHSYLLIDPQTGTASVIDPYRIVDPYLEAAHSMSAKIRHIFLTQQHDDFQGGHRTLAERTGATIFAGAWTRPPFDFLPVKNGDVLEFGQVRLMILETPGHRLEAITVLVFDLLLSDSAPIAAFTGDTLTPGDVGLPEPMRDDGLLPADLARMLHDSIRDKYQGLPSSTRIYPALAEWTSDEPEAWAAGETLLRTQRTQNPAFRPMNSREFEVRILAGMRRDPSLPRGGEELRLRPVTATELLRASRSGAQIIDVRSPSDFAAAHLEKSINVPLAAAFETWVESVLNPDEPALLVAPPGREVEAAARLEDAGFGHVAGFLKGGMQSLEDRTPLLKGERRYTLPGLEEALAGDSSPQVVEIGRSSSSGNGVRVPLEELRMATDQFSHGREIVICSETPFRASAAASYLRTRGFPRVRTLAGGLAMWGRRPGSGLADPALALSPRSASLPSGWTSSVPPDLPSSKSARFAPRPRGSGGSASS